MLWDPRQLPNHFELHFLNSKLGTILLLLRSLWELSKVIYVQFPYLCLISVSIQYVANDCCYSCNSSHLCGMVLLNGLGTTSMLMLGEFFLIFYSRAEDDMSPALQERFAEINLSINYFHWRHLGNMYYKWGNDGPKLSARIVKVLSYPRNLWTSSSSHPAGPLIIEMNVFHLNQYSWVLLEPHNLVDFFFFFYISDVFLFLFFSVFICLFFSSVLNSWLKVCVFFLSSFYQSLIVFSS